MIIWFVTRPEILSEQQAGNACQTPKSGSWKTALARTLVT